MTGMDTDRKKRVGVALGAVALANSAMFLSFGASRLFKHGSELVFGLQARTWGFVLLGLAIVGLAGAIGVLVSSQKPRP